MASKTEYLGLIVPELNDPITPDVFADNYRRIDAAAKANNMRYNNKTDQIEIFYDGKWNEVMRAKLQTL